MATVAVDRAPAPGTGPPRAKPQRARESRLPRAGSTALPVVPLVPSRRTESRLGFLARLVPARTPEHLRIARSPFEALDRRENSHRDPQPTTGRLRLRARDRPCDRR